MSKTVVPRHNEGVNLNIPVIYKRRNAVAVMYIRFKDKTKGPFAPAKERMLLKNGKSVSMKFIKLISLEGIPKTYKMYFKKYLIDPNNRYYKGVRWSGKKSRGDNRAHLIDDMVTQDLK